MKPANPSEGSEIIELRARLAEAEEMLDAIRKGHVDALLVSGPNGDQVFTLQGADKPYRLLIEAMNEGALTVLPDCTILYCNQRFAEMVQVPIQELIGASLCHFVQSEEQAALKTLLAQVQASGSKAEFGLRTDKAATATKPVQLSLRRMEVDDLDAIAVVATDLTERQNYEETLRRHNEDLERRVVERTAELTQANDALQEAQQKLKRYAEDLEDLVAYRTEALRESLKAMESFCYSIAHDLRAPLRTMHGFTAALLEEMGPDLNPQARDYAQRVVHASTRMDDLIRDLLAYGRLSSADLPLLQIDPAKVLQKVLEQIRESESGKKAKIKIEKALPQVSANPVMLEQIFLNLLRNAIKFVPRGVLPRISISAQEQGEWVRLFVQDNGIGIDPQYHERIFRVFERLSPNEYAGTGIGLAIVQKGVERMGGRVGIESQLGKGSCFWLDLRKANLSNG